MRTFLKFDLYEFPYLIVRSYRLKLYSYYNMYNALVFICKDICIFKFWVSELWVTQQIIYLK